MYLFIFFGFSLFGVLPSFVGIIKSKSGNKWHLPVDQTVPFKRINK